MRTKIMPLLDEWKVTGTDMNEFQREISELKNRTYHMKLRCVNEVSYISVVMDDVTKRVRFVEISEDYLEKMEHLPFEKVLPKPAVSSANSQKETFIQLVSESVKQPNLLVTHNTHPIFLAKNVISAFGEIALVKGDATYTHHTLIRNLHLVSELLSRGKPYTLICREYAGYRKAFAAPVKRTNLKEVTDIPQVIQIALDRVDLELFNWEITNYVTTIYLKNKSIESKYGLTPGIIIEDSDVGVTAFKVCSVVFLDSGEYIILDKTTIKSGKNSNINNMAELISKMALSSKYYKFYSDIDAVPDELSVDIEDLKRIFEPKLSTTRLKKIYSKIKDNLEGQKKNVLRVLFEILFISKKLGINPDSSTEEAIRDILGRIPNILKSH